MPDPKVESLDVRVLAGIGFILPNCFGAIAGPESFAIDGSERSMPSGPFDHSFDFATTSCLLDWKATVTFVRTAQREVGPGGGGQSQGGAPPREDCLIPMPQPDPDCADPEEDLIPMPPKRGKLSRNAKQAKLTLTCRVACAGSATAYPSRHGAGAAAARRPLARTRFIGSAGRPTTVVLRFRPKARRAIRRARAVRVELRVAPQTGGTTVRRTVVVRLPRARR